MLTADTITHADIIRLHEETRYAMERSLATLAHIERAIGLGVFSEELVKLSRARCAEIINEKTAPIVSTGQTLSVLPVDIRVGDVLVAWRLDTSGEWSTIGMRGDMKVVQRDKDEAVVASRDTIKLTGYRWQIRRAP